MLPTIDPVMVRRSSRLFPAIYGENFEYEHYLSLSSRGRALGLIAGVIGLMIMTRIPGLRDLLPQLKPAGTGPSLEQRKAARFRLRFFGSTRNMHVITEVRSSHDAYTGTGRMASQCAILLATRRDEVYTSAGVTTPIGAFGRVLPVAMIGAGIRMVMVEAYGSFRLNSSNARSKS
jgi:short subunit dehydrogenase-like uncharacterized protein